ncbi:MAG: thioredoxin [Candidatus Omnitrophica bacterium]|nr:thioredoxin [Candidatus Omnitrophota bacterium]
MSRVVILNAHNFNQEVLETSMPVLVDFWGSWCAPCKMVESVIDALAEELEDTVKIAKCNVDQNPQIQQMYDVAGVPTFILFKDGDILKREVGALSKEQLLNMIEQGLGIKG